jgi:MFS family permease
MGSALAAGAQAWAMLLVGRALQGLGFAGLQTVTKVILSDKVSLKDTSLTNTLFSLFYGLSFAVGPLIGGYLTRVSFLRSRPRSFYLTTPGQLALVFYH